MVINKKTYRSIESVLIKITVIILLIPLKSCYTEKEDECLKGKYEQELSYIKFLNPPPEFRTFPFYSINDSLTEIEIKQQIAGFKQAGFGGFYLHSRAGLITEFLGDGWWRIMKAAVEAGNEAGLQTMFYDEDKWPSGYAGGIIPGMGKEFRAKSLVRYEKKTKLPEGAEIIKSDSLYNYILYTAQYGYDIFNGTCYVDLFNPETVKEFINVSYKPYVDKYKQDLAGYNFAIFSDEPHIHARYFNKKIPNKGALSYSPWLEKKFKGIYGYCLRDKLELLFEEKSNWREVRMQYYRAKALLFEESFTKQISEFCETNGIKYTGHYLGEDVLQKVRDRIGNSMLHYRRMQQPGMDHLGLTIDNKIITAKRLSSVANQYAIPKRLSELFGISGHNMNFQDRKWIGGWHSILGVNHFCPHLTQYSMVGARKRDYPPTFSYHQPYWQYNKKIEDYLSRIAYASTIGEYTPQILVISPLESEYIKGASDGEFTSGVLNLLEALQNAHYDFDIGDEQIMADTATIINSILQIGAMGYGCVVLPDMISIRQTTIDLLLKLVSEGGIVFNTGRFPKYVDGIGHSNKIKQLKNIVINTTVAEITELLPQKVKPNVIIKGNRAEKIWSQLRKAKNGYLLQLANTSNTENIRFTLECRLLNNNVVLWEPSIGKCFNLAPGRNGNFEIEIPASSNIWITSGALSKEAKAGNNYQLPETTKDFISLKNKWEVKRLGPNAITLDFASYSTDGLDFSENEPVIGISSRLAAQHFSGGLILKYTAMVENIPGACNLVIEQPGMYKQIKVNGKKVKFNKQDFYTDHKFYSTDISGLILKGRNEIRLSLDFIAPKPLSPNPKERYGTEIESIYLTGDFGVSGNNLTETFNTQRNNSGDFYKRPAYQFNSFSITTEQEYIKGELTTQGYPFYSGAIELSQGFTIESIGQGKKYFIELPNCESVVSVIELNGQIIDTLCWAPFKTEITNYIAEGGNKLKITLVNSLRNLLGPHHHIGGELIKVGPKSFTGAGGFPDGKGEKNWYDLRRSNHDLKIWTDTYNHIPFGLLEPVKITSTFNN